MPSEIKYRFYPSILNQFQLYIKEEGYEDKDGVFRPYVTFESLIDGINRVGFQPTVSMIQGNDFESDVLIMAKLGAYTWKQEFDKFSDNKFINGSQVNESYFEVLKEVVKRLPEFFSTQKDVSRQYKDILFYGKQDVVGEARIVDMKFTNSYNFPKFQHSFQNLYLWAGQERGYRSMEYIITNFRQVYVETYHLDYDFTSLLEGMEYFKEFLENNRSLITDKKIMS